MNPAPTPRLNSRQFAYVGASVLITALAHATHLPLTILSLVLSLILGRWLHRVRGDGAPVPRWLKLVLIVLLPVLVIAYYGYVFGREPGAALACAMLALKLLETETQHDARSATAFCAFVLMSALLFDTNLGFSLLLFAALALLLATLRELEPRSIQTNTDSKHYALLSNLRSSAIALLAAMPLAAFAFVFFPRLETPLWQTADDATSRTGLADSMSPGSIQHLLLDDSAAFRVAFDTTLPANKQLYWRGPVLTDFDGTSWTRRESSETSNAKSLRTDGVSIGYEITLEPNGKPWLFALDMPLGAPTGDGVESRRDGDLSLVRKRPITDLLRYRLRSALEYRIDPQLSEEQRHNTLELPAGVDPRSIALAQSWRHAGGNDEAIVHAALELFHNEYFYTLSPPALGHDWIDDFLFETRRGFCEHYASAFTFLMRAAGIPARVVVGYQGGYFNKIGNYLLVRQSDAHAWSEVWLEGRGWVRVDPTAAVSPIRIEAGARAVAGDALPWYRAGWIFSVRNQFDLINRAWNSIIVEFDSLRQRSLLVPFGIAQADAKTLVWILIVSSSLLACAAAYWAMHMPRLRLDPVDAAYAMLCKKLARAGLARAPEEGPQDFAARLQDTRTLSGLAVRQAQALLRHYVGLRYACALPAEEAVASFARAVRDLHLIRVTQTAKAQA